MPLNSSDGDDVIIKTADGTPVPKGQQTKDNSLPVVFPSDAPVVVTTRDAKATYSAVVYGLNVASSPTDIFTITGSASKTIKITDITFSATKTANGFGDVLLIKRSSADSGGTSSTAAAVPYDSANAAASATVRSYTANPSSLGTEVGKIAAHRYFYSGLSVAAPLLEFQFGNDNKQPVTLRGASEQLAVNLNGGTLSGNLIDLYVEWTEE